MIADAAVLPFFLVQVLKVGLIDAYRISSLPIDSHFYYEKTKTQTVFSYTVADKPNQSTLSRPALLENKMTLASVSFMNEWELFHTSFHKVLSMKSGTVLVQSAFH